MTKRRSKNRSEAVPEPSEEVLGAEPSEPVMEAEYSEPALGPDHIDDVSDDHRRKHLALWLAVGGTTAVIIAMWLLLLPMQLGEVRLPNAKDISRWSVVTESKKETQSFQENLRILRERLSNPNGTNQPPASAQPPAAIDVQELQQKLEAASLSNEQPPTNEAKK